MKSFVLLTSLLVFLQAAAFAAPAEVPKIIVIDKQGKSRSYTNMPPPIFTHDAHQKRYACDVCHPKPFVAKTGGNIITMRDNMNGDYCGKCHDGMRAAGMAKCDSCHRAP